MTDNVIQRRLNASDNALASVRLSGLEPDPILVQEVREAAYSGVSLAEILEKFTQRVKSGQLQKHKL